jgi:molecular chaperone DnaK
LRDYGDKIPADTKSKVEAEISNVKSAIGSDDPGRIKNATEQLNQIVQEIGGAMYQQGGPAAGPS